MKMTGQYRSGNSCLHRLDGRAKLVCLILLMAAVIAADSVWRYALVVAAVAVVVGLSRLPVGLALGSLVRLWPFFVTIFAMNALFYDGADAIFSWWIVHLSASGVEQGARVIVHVALILVLTNVLTMTTPPMDLTGAITSLISPLRIFRLPVEEIAMILGAAIQFIPTLLDEADTIRKAQIARGARFESRKLTERAAALLPMAVPVFISAFRRADELSLAMEARGYRGAKNRTGRKSRALGAADVTAMICGAGLCLVQLIVL
jgi:energy-coupling factor transport system permease protein